jgi:serine/threonine protein kinase
MTSSQSELIDEPAAPEAAGLDDPRVIQAAEEYASMLRSGQRPDRPTFLARHSEIAPALGECLDGLDFIFRAAPEVGHADALAADGEPDDCRPELRGDFRIIRKIGRGGMGIVFEAEQVSLGRRVALKVLPFAAALDERHLQRFKQEAQAAALLHHTNIVPIFAVGAEHGVHYYAMQYIEGRNLAAVIHELRYPNGPPQVGPLDATLPYGTARWESSATRSGLSTEPSVRNWNYVRMAAGLVAQVAEALAHAHRHGVVHRDIKPANLLIDTHGTPWITDFGLARLQAEGGLTVPGDLIGTLRYMSPEQATGGGAAVDHRTDVYALGATLYELLTLQPPFDGPDRQAIIQQIMRDEPVAPRRLNDSVPADLEVVVQKAMAKAVDERYATAQAFADDLRRFLQDRPIQARRPSLGQRILKWARRHLAVVTAGALAAIVSLVALSASTALIWRAKNAAQTAYDNEATQRTQSDKNLRRAERNLELALQALDEVYLRIAERRFPGDPVLERADREVLQKAITFYQQFSAENRDSPQVRWETVRAYRRVGEIYQWLGRPAKAEEALRQAVAMGERLTGELPANAARPRVLADCLSSLGILLQETNRLAEAERIHRRALDIRRSMTEEEPDDAERQLDLAASRLNLGIVLNRANRLTEAATSFEGALDLLKWLPMRFPGSGDGRRYRIHLAQACQSWGTILARLDRYPEAETALRQAESRWRALAAELERTPGPRDNLARSLHALATVLGALGRCDAAETSLRESLILRKRLAADFAAVPGYRDAVAGSQQELARMLERQARVKEAAEEAFQSLAARKKLVEEFPTVPQYLEGLARSYYALGAVRRAAGRTGEARQAFRDAANAWDRFAARFAAAPEHRYLVALGLLELGLLLQSDGQLSDAERSCRRALALLVTLTAEIPNTALYTGALSNAHQHLGSILRDAERLREAEESYRAGVVARLSLGEPSTMSPHERYRLANAYHNLGDVLLRRQDNAEAEKACQNSFDLRKDLPESLQLLPENRHILALDRLTLATTAKAAGRSGDFADHLAGALELARSLIAEFPKDNRYRDTLSSILAELGVETNVSRGSESRPIPAGIIIAPCAPTSLPDSQSGWSLPPGSPSVSEQ